MSLTDFVEWVKPTLNQLFDMPAFDLKDEMKAAPISMHYGFIGTSFDYVLRLQVAKINKNLVTDFPIVGRIAANGNKFREQIITDFELAKTRYLNDELELSDLLPNCIQLAILDTLSRTGIDSQPSADEDIKSLMPKKLRNDKDAFKKYEELHEEFLPPPLTWTPDPKDIADLAGLTNIVDTRMWQAKTRCILNPTFGKSSFYIGGADADLIIDDKLIDIKTTKYLKFTRQYFRQLIGYHLLNCREQEMYKGLEHLGIYYSRHGILFTFPIPNMKRNIKFGDKVIDEEVIESWIQIYHEEINKIPPWRIIPQVFDFLKPNK
jgi:hypothetical protein